jgi:hypothetical protein
MIPFNAELFILVIPLSDRLSFREVDPIDYEI